MIEDQIPQNVYLELLQPNKARPIERVLGGLSSSPIFRCIIETGENSTVHACLKGTPASPQNFERLQLAEKAISSANKHEPRVLPSTLPPSTHPFAIRADELYWQLSQWMPGKANYLEQPSDKKLRNAVSTLAQLHVVWAKSPNAGHLGPIDYTSPAMDDRIRMLEALTQQSLLDFGRPANLREEDLARRTSLQLVRLGKEWLEQLLFHRKQPIKLHTVLRDIWSDHVLFVDEAVSGIIDLGAIRIDEPATDVARLIGSLEPNSPARWRMALETYRHINPSVSFERVALLDKVSCLLSAVQWYRWLIAERRQFHSPATVLLNRWELFLSRLESDFWSELEE